MAEHGEWDEARLERAMDLLGVAPEERPSDPFGLRAATPEALLDLAEAQVHELRGLKDSVLDALDERERSQAEQGQFTEVPKSLALVRRYAAACLRRLRWYLAELADLTRTPKAGSPTRSPAAPTPKPAPSPATPPKPPSPLATAPSDPAGSDRIADRPVATQDRTMAAPRAPSPAPSPSPGATPPPADPAPRLNRRARRARLRKARRRG